MADDPLKQTPWCELDRDNRLYKRRPHRYRRSVRYGTYDEWKLANPDDGWHPRCPGCDDYGCPLCCETQPIDEDDLDMMSGPDDDDNPPRL